MKRRAFFVMVGGAILGTLAAVYSPVVLATEYEPTTLKMISHADGTVRFWIDEDQVRVIHMTDCPNGFRYERDGRMVPVGVAEHRLELCNAVGEVIPPGTVLQKGESLRLMVM